MRRGEEKWCNDNKNNRLQKSTDNYVTCGRLIAGNVMGENKIVSTDGKCGTESGNAGADEGGRVRAGGNLPLCYLPDTSRSQWKKAVWIMFRRYVSSIDNDYVVMVLPVLFR